MDNDIVFGFESDWFQHGFWELTIIMKNIQKVFRVGWILTGNWNYVWCYQ